MRRTELGEHDERAGAVDVQTEEPVPQARFLVVGVEDGPIHDHDSQQPKEWNPSI